MIRLQKHVRLLRRHAFKSQHPIHSFVRHGSSRNREPYILPRLAIDLDAYDAPNVRPATEEDFALPPKPPRRRLPYEHVVTRGKQDKGLQLNSVPRFALDVQTVTAPDLLAYALLGNPNASPTSENLAFRRQFRQQKIHPLDNADTKIKRLTHDFTTDASKVLESAGLTPERKELIVEEIRQCVSFQKLTRMLSMLSSTTEGCTLLAYNKTAVLDGIGSCRKHRHLVNSKVSPGAVLLLLNNLILNLQSKMVYLFHPPSSSQGQQLSALERFAHLSKFHDETRSVHTAYIECLSALCQASLYYASKKLSFPSIRHYLKMAEEFSGFPLPALSGDAVLAISALVISSHRQSSFHSRSKHYLGQEVQNREALTLLTGWSSGGTPSNQEKRQACFASSIVPRAEGAWWGFREYIVALGYIGASDSIWYEWQNDPSYTELKGSNQSPSQFDFMFSVGTTGSKAEICALAFLMAGDHSRAMDVLRMFFTNEGRYKFWIRPAAEKAQAPTDQPRPLHGAFKSGEGHESEVTAKVSSEQGNAAVVQSSSAPSQARNTKEDMHNALNTRPALGRNDAGRLSRGLADTVLANENEDPSQPETPAEPSPRSIKLGLWTRKKILWYYQANHMTPTQQLHERIEAEFIPDSPETILHAVDDLLVPAWLKYKQSKDAAPEDFFAYYEVDWIVQDGREGIAIKKGDEVVHFKPSSRQPLSQDEGSSSESSPFPSL